MTNPLDAPTCAHPFAKRVQRGDFKLMACDACQSWWDRAYPANVKPYPLPPIVRAPTQQKRAMPKDDIDAVRIADLVEEYRRLEPGERALARAFMAKVDES